MATKALRSLSNLPGLEGDTYTIAATDATLALAGEPADAKAAGDAIAAASKPAEEGDAIAVKTRQLINYGYDVDYNGQPSSNCPTVTRRGMIVTLNGVAKVATVGAMIKLNSDVQYASGTASYQALTDPVTLTVGRVYRASMTLLSGSHDGNNVYVSAVKDGGNTAVGNVFYSSDGSYNEFVYDGTGVHIGIRIGDTSSSVTFSNAKYLVTLEDIEDEYKAIADSVIIDDKIGLLNYGFSNAYSGYVYGPSGSNRIMMTRSGMVFDLHGYVPVAQTMMFVKISNTPASAASATNIANLTEPLTGLTQGHTYRLKLKVLEGTIEAAEDGGLTAQAVLAGTSTYIGTTSATGGVYTNEFVYTGSAGVHIGFAIDRGEESVSINRVRMIATLEDLTESDRARSESIAPVQGSTASTNIASGELLMQDGKLYKATQAIVAGAEIGATNTTLTTIAAQLAALEARIAALEN